MTLEASGSFYKAFSRILKVLALLNVSRGQI